MRETISLGSMAQLLRHIAGHVKGKKKQSTADEYGVPGMRGHSHGPRGAAGKTKQPAAGTLKSPKIGGKAQGRDPINKFGIVSKNVHASAARIVDDFLYLVEGLPVDAAFRKKHGVPPSGPGPHPASSYKLPMPPATHPLAKKFARAVLSRAKKTKGVSPANVAKQVGKANRVLYGKSNPTASAKAAKREADLREYIPEKPAGSWERISSLISKAAQDGDQFGGPVEYDYDKRGPTTPAPYDINVWASFPQKSAVIVSNELTGKLYFANYAITDGEVEFSNIKPVTLGIQAAQESWRKRRSIVDGLLEAGAQAQQIATLDGVVIMGAFVEGMHIAGSAEETVGALSPRVAKVKKHVRQLGKLVASSPCPCGDPTHRPKLIASFPQSKTLVTDCEAGMHSMPYGVVGGRFKLGKPTKVKAKLVPVKPAKEAARTLAGGGHGRIRENATATTSPANLHLFARIREAKVDEKAGTATADCIMLVEGWGNKADNHYYPAETIKNCVDAGIFEGAQAYADHPNPIEDRMGVRSVKDMIGWWGDVHVEEIDGKTAMCGTFNIETGNTFALNKMREAKNYREKYPDKAGYVGFSINALGESEPQEIEDKAANVVTKITESESTDMVTRAGAGGTMRNLKEVDKVAKAIEKLGLDAEGKKMLKAIVTEALATNRAASGKQLREAVMKTVRKFCEDAGFTLSPEQDKALDKALGLVDGGPLDQAIDNATGVGQTADDQTDDEEDAMDLGELGGDDSVNNAPDPDDPENDETTVESAKLKKVVTENDFLKKQLAKANAKEATRKATELATKLAEEHKIPAAGRAFFLESLLEVDGGETKMRDKAKAIAEFFGVALPIDVEGNPAREAAVSGSGLIVI